MNYELLSVTVESSVAWITITREPQLNALNAQLLGELTEAVTSLDADSAVRCMVITGSGPKAFCAGADIKAMQQMSFEDAGEFVALGQRCMNTIDTAQTPIIGMVNGFALGGGAELALACHFLYASDNARFGLPEVTLGLFPGFGGTQRLLRAVGKGRTNDLIMTGRVIRADKAAQWGIFNDVVSQDELHATVTALAQSIVKNSPVAIRVAKKLIRGGADQALTEGLASEQKAFPDCFLSQDTKEGLAAFVEKRAANFPGQ